MIKAVFFDVDGTLLSHRQRSVPESTRRALVRLREAGIALVVATGRHREELKRLPLDLSLFDAMITLNGQLCYLADGQRFFHREIAAEDTMKIVSLFEAHSFPLALVNENGIYLNFSNEHVARVQADISTGTPALGQYQGERLYQAIAFLPAEEAAAYIEDMDGVRLSRWHGEAVDWLPVGGSKRAGIEALAGLKGWQRSEIMAFGDGDNDIEMLLYAGMGVAMGNASSGAKEQAAYVTDSVDDDGIWNFIEAHQDKIFP